MVFSSESFLFLFLPLFLGLYYTTPDRWRSFTLLAGSYAFYGWWRIDYLLLLIATTVFVYYVGRAIRGASPSQAKIWCGVGVTACLGLLGLFKYMNFFVDSFAALFGTDAAGLGIHWRILLPIGISFYIFQAISYLVDTYRGDVGEEPSLLDFAAFIALFPQLIAGPILRYKDLADQFAHRTHSLDMFLDGMMRFFVGLAKKVLLADAVAPLADLAFATENPSMTLAWLGAIAYMMQLYFDFSGYSDMAIGLGKMMGFRFVENFDTPYISRSITEFWRRWHISLSVWLRDYLYIPLGGNRRGVARTYLNLMAVMVLGGMWHGAAWTFVAWGFWHGGWLALERATGLDRGRDAGALLRTLVVVLIGWVAFRAPDMGAATEIYAGMIGAHGIALSSGVAVLISFELLAALAICIAVAALEPALNRMVLPRMTPRPVGPWAGIGALMPTLLVSGMAALTVMRLAEMNFSPFLYFQF
ncbi:MAG: MBOAT family O-acyltransferase [Limimaricola soesokkakensis]|uniref:MBOAT family O-acyltransferase n=1 Tax=Limimaricola soesokkakensis TaxID=1343159 RepID=UPI004058122C